MNQRVKMLCVAIFGAGSLTLGAGASATSTDRQREDRCDVQARSGHVLETVAMPDLHVLEQASYASFAPALPRGAEAIVCLRTSITPAAHDDKVLALGIPLIIVEVGRPHRMGVLEIAGGAFRYRLTEGTLAAADQAAVQARLEEYRARIPATAG